MPTDGPMLSDRVQKLADLAWGQHGCAAKGSRQEEVLREEAKTLSEAAQLLARYEQPEVVDLLTSAAPAEQVLPHEGQIIGGTDFERERRAKYVGAPWPAVDAAPAPEPPGPGAGAM